MTVPVVALGPEKSFRMGDIVIDRSTVSSTMVTGRWLADRDGTPLTGALGVLVDDVVGYAMVRDRPQGRWSVSSEITIDLLRPLVLDGRDVTATTTGTPHHDGLGGYARGAVADADGAVVAVVAQRGRWVPFGAGFAVTEAPGTLPTGATNIEDLLGAEPSPVEGGACVEVDVGPLLVNPMGNLHGGLSLCLSDLAASATTEPGTRWITESLRIQYLRPVPGGAKVEFRAIVRHRGRSRAIVDVSGLVDGRLCTSAAVARRPT